MKYQQKDNDLTETATYNKNYKIKQFHGTGKEYSLICFNNKIVIPKQLQKRTID